MISIVIPIYNEEENIQMLYERITKAAQSWNEKYEVVWVNDGSSDQSLKLMKNYVDRNPAFRVVNFSRNFGHQAAISAGLRHAKGDAVVIMDGDLQDPPEELGRFLDKWREGYDVVYAIRTKRKEGIFKRMGYFFFYRILQRISNIDIPLDSGDFCVMDKKVVRALNYEMPEKIRFVRGLRAFAGFRQVGVKYERASRAAGEAKYTFRKLLRLAIDGIFDFSTFPLRMATYLGFLIAVPSFLLGIFFIFHRILGFKILGHAPGEVPGMATLAVSIFFLGGVVLIMLGIIGEYIGRIYIEVKRRPTYIVEELIEQEENPKKDK